MVREFMNLLYQYWLLFKLQFMKVLRLVLSISVINQIYVGNYIFARKLILNTRQGMRLKFARTFRSLGKVQISEKVCVSFLNYPHLIIKMHYTFSMYLNTNLSNWCLIFSDAVKWVKSKSRAGDMLILRVNLKSTSTAIFLRREQTKLNLTVSLTSIRKQRYLSYICIHAYSIQIHMYYLALLVVIFAIKQGPYIRPLCVELISHAKRLFDYRRNEAIYPDDVIQLFSS
jgi:hypothetical protein